MSDFPKPRKSPIIRDGYTKFHTFPDTDWYDGFHIEFRQSLTDERMALLVRINSLKDADTGDGKRVAEAERLCNREIAARVKWWDIQDDKGEVVPVTEDICDCLMPQAQGAIFNVVMSLKPTVGEQESQDEKESSDRKNSPAG